MRKTRENKQTEARKLVETDQKPSPIQPELFDGVIIIGAGLVGALSALMLSQKGISVKVFEARSDFRLDTSLSSSSPIKRSINLALSLRGQEALKSVGLLEKAMSLSIPMFGRAIHTEVKKYLETTTKSETDRYEPDQIQKYDEIDSKNYINSISREGLNKLLLDECDKKDNIKVCFNCKLERIDKDIICYIRNKNKNNELITIISDLIIGCDGSNSITRDWLIKYNYSNYSKYFIDHGYKEFQINKEEKDGQYKLKKENYLHIWPRGDFMMIALPNLDKTFTATLFAPLVSSDEMPISQKLQQMSSKKEEEDILNKVGMKDLDEDEILARKYFEKYFPDVCELIPDYLEQMKRNPTSRLVQVKLDNWFFTKKVDGKKNQRSLLVIGDAAHACVPFFGQGMNSGFEDVLELSLLIDSHQSLVRRLSSSSNSSSTSSSTSSVTNGKGGLSYIHKIAELFNRTRVKQAQGCGVLSYDNYKEMRDHTASTMFLLQKKLEAYIGYFFGDQVFMPLYKMVTFTRIPYNEVIERDQRQKRMMKRVKVGLGVFSVVAIVSSVFYVCSKKNNERSVV